MGYGPNLEVFLNLLDTLLIVDQIFFKNYVLGPKNEKCAFSGPPYILSIHSQLFLANSVHKKLSGSSFLCYFQLFVFDHSLKDFTFSKSPFLNQVPSASRNLIHVARTISPPFLFPKSGFTTAPAIWNRSVSSKD